MSEEQAEDMSEARIWSKEFSDWRGEQFTAKIVPAADMPGALRATLHKDGTAPDEIFVSPQQLGEFVQRLAETASRLEDPDASVEDGVAGDPDEAPTGVTISVSISGGTTGGRRTRDTGRIG